MNIHHFGIQPELIPHLKSGAKKLEIRVADDKRLAIMPKDTIVFSETIHKKIVTIRQYPSFVEMLRREDSSEIEPGKTKDEILHSLRARYPKEKELLGVLVFELQVDE